MLTSMSEDRFAFSKNSIPRTLLPFNLLSASRRLLVLFCTVQYSCILASVYNTNINSLQHSTKYLGYSEDAVLPSLLIPSSLPMTAHQSQNIVLNEGHHGLESRRTTARSLRTPPAEQRELPLLPSCRNSAIPSFFPHEILSPNLRFFTVNYSLVVNFSFFHAISTRTFEV
jgi:hypothetical protein